MKHFDVVLPDEMVKDLEEHFTREEVEILINQAVLRHLQEEVNRQKSKDPTKDPSQDDLNRHEWTS